MKDIVTYREPKLKPLPPSITPQIQRDAQLPMRLEAAKRAIAECFDLSELMNWKDKAAAIAAAAKVAKMPELARGANRVCKEALLRLGQLLNEYNNVVPRTHDAAGRIVMSCASPRTAAGLKAGLSKTTITCATRIAAAPTKIARALIDDERVPPIAKVMAKLMPARAAKGTFRRHDSRLVTVTQGVDEFGRRRTPGLNGALAAVRNVPLNLVRALAPDEKKLVRTKVAEIMELLDAIDEAAK